MILIKQIQQPKQSISYSQCQSRLNLRSDSEISDTYQTASKINPSSNINNNMHLQEPTQSFCNSSAHKDFTSQMEKADDIFSQVSNRPIQQQIAITQNGSNYGASNNQMPSQILQGSYTNQSYGADYKLESIPYQSRKRNSDQIQIKPLLTNNQYQRQISIGNQQSQIQYQSQTTQPNPLTMNINGEQMLSQKVIQRMSIGSLSDLEQYVTSFTNIQRRDDKRKSTILKPTVIIQQSQQNQLKEEINSGFSNIIASGGVNSNNNNQLQVHRSGSKNLSVKFNDHHTTPYHEKTCISYQNNNIQFFQYSMFDIEYIFDVAKEFSRYFTLNNVSNVLKSFNASQNRKRSKSRNIKNRKVKGNTISKTPKNKQKKEQRDLFQLVTSTVD